MTDRRAARIFASVLALVASADVALASWGPNSDICRLARTSSIIVSGRVEGEDWVKRPDRFRTPTMDPRDGTYHLQDPDEYIVGSLSRIRIGEVVQGEGLRPNDTLQVFLKFSWSLHDPDWSHGALRVGGSYLLFLAPLDAAGSRDGGEPVDLSGATVGALGPPAKGDTPVQSGRIYRPLPRPRGISALSDGAVDAVRACWDEALRPPNVAWLVSPEGGPKQTLPVFVWRTVGNATSYQLTVIGPGPGDIAFETIVDAADACVDSTCQTASPGPLAPGPYRWTIEARNRFGNSGKVVPLGFFVGVD